MRFDEFLLNKVYENNTDYVEFLALQDFVASRIESLWHFSSFKNLESICKHGILQPKSLFGRKLNFVPTDGKNVSHNDLGVSLTLGYPNTKMIYSKFKSHSDLDQDNFVLFEVSPRILESGHFLCFPTNAARFVKLQSADLREFIGTRGLRKAFLDGFCLNEADVRVSRSVLGLHDTSPTDPQTEIVYLGDIAVDSIRRVVVSRRQLLSLGSHPNQLTEWFPNSEITFTGRMYYGSWQRPDINFWLPNRAIDYSTLVESEYRCGCENCLYLGL